MSVEVMSAVYRAKLGGPKIKAVALKLADHANNEGRGIYPSKQTVAEQTELSVSTVHRAIRQLLSIGVLVKVRASKGGKAKATTVYRFDLDALSRLPPVAAPRARKGCQGDIPKTAQGCQGDIPRGVRVTHEPSNQPSKNKYQPSVQASSEGRLNFDFDLVGEAEPAHSARQEHDADDWVDDLDAAGEARLVAEAREAAEAAKPTVEPKPAGGARARINRLPVMPEVLAKLQLMGMDVPKLIAEFEREIGNRSIDNPSGYLMGMARRRVAQRDGVPEAMVDALYSTDVRKKGEAMAALVGSPVERRWKGARHRMVAGNGAQPVGSHLAAALANRGLGA